MAALFVGFALAVALLYLTGLITLAWKDLSVGNRSDGHIWNIFLRKGYLQAITERAHEMGLWLTVARSAMGVNILLLVGLSYVWAENYRSIRSKHVLALFLFAVLLLAENVVALYFFSLNPLTRQWLETAEMTIQAAIVLLRLLETSALALLTWAMWQ